MTLPWVVVSEERRFSLFNYLQAILRQLYIGKRNSGQLLGLRKETAVFFTHSSASYPSWLLAFSFWRLEDVEVLHSPLAFGCHSILPSVALYLERALRDPP